MGVDNYQDYNRVLGSLMRGRVSGRIAKAIRAQVSLLAASPALIKVPMWIISVLLMMQPACST